MPPGASTDAVARLMAEQIGRAQGVTIVVENRPGASGMIGTEQVSRAAPDGNTLLMTANTYLIDAQTRKANYHPVTAFDPICYLVQSPAVFVVNSASPYRTLKDLLDAARAKPGELSMAAVGPGTTFQMGFNTFTRAAGVNMTFVPYQGSAPAATAVMGQHVTSAFAGYAVVVREYQGRQAAGARRRHDEADRSAAGCADLRRVRDSRIWKSTIGSASSRRCTRPRRFSSQYAGWLKAALQDPEVKAKLALQGLYPVGMCGDEFAAYVRSASTTTAQMIRESNIKAQ